MGWALVITMMYLSRHCQLANCGELGKSPTQSQLDNAQDASYAGDTLGAQESTIVEANVP